VAVLVGPTARLRSPSPSGNIRVKYKQAVLSVAWAVLHPLVFIAIFTLTIGRIEGVSSEGVPYAAVTLSALDRASGAAVSAPTMVEGDVGLDCKKR
jgi:hypothetical protein